MCSGNHSKCFSGSQVLTLSSPPQGPGNVTWMCERKRDRVNMETKKKILVIAVVLLLVGFMFWNCGANNGGKNRGYLILSYISHLPIIMAC